MNQFCSVMSHAKCILLLQNEMLMQNQSILKHDESRKMHFALGNGEVRAK